MGEAGGFYDGKVKYASDGKTNTPRCHGAPKIGKHIEAESSTTSPVP